MNVNKAKNLTIIFFIALNLILLSINFSNSRKYQLSEKQKNMISSLLDENNIILYSRIITDFKPVKQLSLSQEYMDINYVAAWLFDTGEEYRVIEDFEKTVLLSEGKTLSYDNKQFVLDIPGGTGKIPLNSDNARRICEEKLATLKERGLNFEFDTDAVDSETGSMTLEYRIKYGGYYVYSSYIKFKVTSSGIEQIKCLLLTCVGFVDDAREIYSADEALLALMYELKSIYGESNYGIAISRMDMVYYLDYSKTSENSELKAIPYYRFYIPDRTEPFLINAYFNTVLKL